MLEFPETNPMVDEDPHTDKSSQPFIEKRATRAHESMLKQAFSGIPATDFFGQPWCRQVILNKLLKNNPSPFFEPESDSCALLQNHFLNPKMRLLNNRTLYKNLYETVIRGLLQLRKLTEGTITEKALLLSLFTNIITQPFAYIRLDTREASLKSFNSYVTKFALFSLERILGQSFEFAQLLHPEQAVMITKALENMFVHVVDGAADNGAHVSFLFYESQDPYLNHTSAAAPLQTQHTHSAYATITNICA